MRELPRQGMSWTYLSTEWMPGGEIDIDCLKCVRISQETSVFPPKNELFRLAPQTLKCKLSFLDVSIWANSATLPQINLQPSE